GHRPLLRRREPHTQCVGPGGEVAFAPQDRLERLEPGMNTAGRVLGRRGPGVLAGAGSLIDRIERGVVHDAEPTREARTYTAAEPGCGRLRWGAWSCSIRRSSASPARCSRFRGWTSPCAGNGISPKRVARSW